MCIHAGNPRGAKGIGGESGVPHYEKYTTTVIGAHSVPRWYEAMDRLVSSGQLAPGDFIDAQLRATQAAILEQEIAGIDVITGGEMHRRTHNRHSPPNAMLNYFWQMIPAFQGETKPKPITRHDPHVFHPAAICRGPIVDTIDLGLAEEFKTVSSFARKPVKVTMTGPHLLAAVAYDEFYDDMQRMMADFGKLLRHNFRMLVDAGCKHIQIDEPYFTASTEVDVAAAVDVINQMIEDIPDDVHVGLFARATMPSDQTTTDKSVTVISTLAVTRPTLFARSIATSILSNMI
jgi:5-methyltetrahydropteroyltriglutamate--homocysteine methyltransferase